MSIVCSLSVKCPQWSALVGSNQHTAFYNQDMHTCDHNYVHVLYQPKLTRKLLATGKYKKKPQTMLLTSVI